MSAKAQENTLESLLEYSKGETNSTASPKQQLENLKSQLQRFNFSFPLPSHHMYISGTDKIGRKLLTVARFPSPSKFPNPTLMLYFAHHMEPLV